MKKQKLKPLSKQEHAELWSKVDSEGFGYYMLQYGPDMDAIERLGFNRKEVEIAINTLSRVEEEIMRGEEFAFDLKYF